MGGMRRLSPVTCEIVCAFVSVHLISSLLKWWNLARDWVNTVSKQEGWGHILYTHMRNTHQFPAVLNIQYAYIVNSQDRWQLSWFSFPPTPLATNAIT